MVQELNGGQFVLVEFDDEELNDLKFAKINELLDILQYQLEANDIYLVSEAWQTLSNSDAAVSFYSVRNDLSYLVAVEDIKKMGKSGNLMMYGHTPDEYDLEDIERVFGDEEDANDEYLKESKKKLSYDEAVKQFDKFCDALEEQYNTGGDYTDRSSNNKIIVSGALGYDEFTLLNDGSLKHHFNYYEDDASDDGWSDTIIYDSLEDCLKKSVASSVIYYITDVADIDL